MLKGMQFFGSKDLAKLECDVKKIKNKVQKLQAKIAKGRSGAFSIAELAVVVAAVGLLAFGVLKSGELILNAKVKALVHEIQEIKNAMSSFKIANDYLPGDVPVTSIQREDGDTSIDFTGFGVGNADGIISYGYYVAPSVATGTADYTISATNCPTATPNESATAFAHMALAGYLSNGVSNTAANYQVNLANHPERLGAGYSSAKIAGLYYSFLAVKSTAATIPAFLTKAGDFGNFNGTNLILGGTSTLANLTSGTPAASAFSDVLVLDGNTTTGNATGIIKYTAANAIKFDYDSARSLYFTSVGASGVCSPTGFTFLPTPTKAIISPSIASSLKQTLGANVKSCDGPNTTAAASCNLAKDQVVSLPIL